MISASFALEESSFEARTIGGLTVRAEGLHQGFKT